MKLVGIFLLLCTSSLFSSAPAKAAAQQPAAEAVAHSADSQPAAAAAARSEVSVADNASAKWVWEASFEQTSEYVKKTQTLKNITSGAWVSKITRLKPFKKEGEQTSFENICRALDLNVAYSCTQGLNMLVHLMLLEEARIVGRMDALEEGLKKCGVDISFSEKDVAIPIRNLSLQFINKSIYKQRSYGPHA